MCGIAGWVGAVDATEETLRRMTGAVRHRGPDDAGAHLVPGRVALGFRRLAIIDLAGGNQPLFSEDRSVAVTCNGEIYNFPELRRQLQGRSHRLASHSDVEVVAHLYEEQGVECLHALQGMFAVALWDEARDLLLLACDRMGVKPLYWAEVPGGLVYGSEPAAILASGLVAAEPDPAALMQYLTLQYVPAPLTGFSGIRKLAPGERLLYRRGAYRVERWWDLAEAAAAADDFADSSDEATIAALDDLLREATHSRLRSDVPLGAFLSGGIDSSLVVSYMAERTAGLKTFSIDVAESGFSEGRHARTVAELYGTDHTELVVRPEMVPTIAHAVRHAGEPFADSSLIPTYLVSELTRNEVTVALSGDGGDEAFGGYQRFVRARQLDLIAPLAARPAVVAGRLVPAGVLERRPRLQRRLTLLGQTPQERYAGMLTHFSPTHLERLCLPEFVEAAGGTRHAWDVVLALPRADGLNRYLLQDATRYLPGDILVKVDRMSMAHALEVRAPFLDYRVQAFAAGLPPRFKIRRGQTKWLLRMLALRRGLPHSAVERTKMGFAIPVGRWFRTELRDWIGDLVLSPSALGRGYFDPHEVRRILDDHVSGRVDRDAQLWNLGMLELWHRAWIDRPVARPATEAQEATA